MNENELHNRIAKGARAQQELDSLSEAFKMLGDKYLEDWKATDSDDVERRERLYASYALLDRVEANLRSIADDGKVAQVELDHHKMLEQTRAH